MPKVVSVSGNHAAAWAARTAEPAVIAAYPITPQTTIVEKIADFVEGGELSSQYVRVESEHSAMAACIGASALGLRTFTATSSHGLALMHEMLHWAGRARLPIVMPVVNRAMGPPWNIWTDHTDSMSQRDTGWIQFYASNNQEVYDTVLMLFRLSEDPKVLLPSMVCLDAFILSHTFTPTTVYEHKEIRDFLPDYKAGHWKLDPKDPMATGNIAGPEYYYELSYAIHEGFEAARKLIPRVVREFEKHFGRSHGGFIDTSRCEDAEVILWAMGTMGEEATLAVENLRQQGIAAGSARLRVFRPFPVEQIQKLASKAKAFVVVDRSLSYGHTGGQATEIRSALYRGNNRIPVQGVVAGLGGRDVTQTDLEKLIQVGFDVADKGEAGPEIFYGLKR
ncbi:MAG: transketolase C-terminal domain-containing protein [Promethearchaeota archaeon]